MAHAASDQTTTTEHNLFTHFPNDPNCEICKHTKVVCRRSAQSHILRATKVGDINTADHKVLNEEGESRNDQKVCNCCARFGHSMDSKLPMENKNFTRTRWISTNIFDPEENPKVIYTNNSMEFGKACECLQWNHSVSTPCRPETNGIAERAERRVSRDSMNSGGQNQWNVMAIYAMSRNFCQMGQLHTKWANHTVRSTSRIPSKISERSSDVPSVWQESAPRPLFGVMLYMQGEVGKETHS